MTHQPYNFVLSLFATGFIFAAVSGLPTLYLLFRAVDARPIAGKAVAASIVPIWLVAWGQTTWLWTIHGKLQREAAAASGCLGYAEGQFPQECLGVMSSPTVVPDGFYFWSAIALGFAGLGLALMGLDSLLGHVQSDETPEVSSVE